MRKAALLFPYLVAATIAALIVLDIAIWRDVPKAMPSCHEAAATQQSADDAPAHVGLDGIPPLLYYSSIAFVLLVSFLIIEHRRKRPGIEQAGPRFDLLRMRWLRAVIVNPATRVTAQLTLVACFALIIVAGLFGNQLPAKNIAPLLTWTLWWGGLILLILYAGKAWCYVCPWDAVAGWAERMSLNGRRQGGLSLGLRWPRALRNIWPATILFVGLTWLELGFSVTMRPRATAWLGLGMLALAFVSAFIFDRKAFCRYGCLVGRVSGLYALFSPVEVRAKDRTVCTKCPTQSCFRGNDRGDPCPTFQYPAVMQQNTYCIACMECVKTCESDNIAVNLRPWGTDLYREHRPRTDEAYLALLMLSITGFHGVTMTPVWASFTEALRVALGVGEAVVFTIGMTAIMIGPIGLYAALVAISRWVSTDREHGYRDQFLRYAYALLPIALFYHLAHNAEHLFLEGQRLVALASDPFGLEWNLFGTATWSVQPLVHMQTLWAIQILLVLVGHVYSLVVARRVASTVTTGSVSAMRSQVPMLAAMIVFSVLSLWLLKQPMQMRSSWM